MIDTYIDIAASVAAARTEQTAHGMVKTQADLERYEKIIAATNPEVLIECGTWNGYSAHWFSRHIPTVISIDIELSLSQSLSFLNPPIFLSGSSTASKVVEQVRRIASGHRTMVVLDSDHHAGHVAEEIRLYGPMVARGCYLVVEDGISEWLVEDDYEGPLYAIERELLGDAGWRRDMEIERLSPVSMHPAGWWEKL